MNHMILAECPGVFLFKIISNLRSLRFFYGCWSPCVVNTAVWRTPRRRTRRQWKMMPEVKSVSWCSKQVLHKYTKHLVVCKVYIYILCVTCTYIVCISIFIINIWNHYHVRFLEWHQNRSTQSQRSLQNRHVSIWGVQSAVVQKNITQGSSATSDDPKEVKKMYKMLLGFALIKAVSVLAWMPGCAFVQKDGHEQHVSCNVAFFLMCLYKIFLISTWGS